ncbi:MAG: hypothetical protein IJ455_04765 [Agathobacter sp.]|nr:hypothetical protein [Agathobacter sp.]
MTITFITSSCSTCNPTKGSCGTEISNKPSESITDTDFNETNDLMDITDSETAYILDIDLENNSIMIGETLNTDYFCQTEVFLKEDTRILMDLNYSNIDDLAIGTLILIAYTGGIAESAPAQMHHPVQIEVIKTHTETAYIVNINLECNYIMIGNSLDTDYFQQTQVLLKDNTTILINGIPAQLEDLSIGNQISITFTGDILESAPAQMTYPIEIEVIK